MVLDLVDRKHLELQTKAASLDAEFDYWQQASAAADGPFSKNYSQIRRITAQLTGLRDQIDHSLNREMLPDQFLSGMRSMEEQILTVHCIWEFFRSKLMLRHDPWFKRHLQACDEFAWACYEPAWAQFKQQAVDPVLLKEPPLIFLNSGWSPFVLPRDKGFQVEPTSGGWIASEPFQAILQKLPIPLVGIPWYSAFHLPDALAIAHEVGHIVELDFQLNPIAHLESRLIPPERLTVWQQWVREIFADLYGCLCVGSAYLDALMDLLFDNARRIAQETATGPHPTRFLRMLINTEILEQSGFGQAARSLLDRWKAVYSSHAMTAFEPDIPAIVDTLLVGPYPSFGNRGLADVISFRSLDQGQSMSESAKITAEQLRRNLSITSQDTRVLVTAAHQLYTDSSQRYHDQHYGEKILSRIIDTRPPGLRAGEQQKHEAQLRQLEAADRQQGAALFSLLFPAAEGES